MTEIILWDIQEAAMKEINAQDSSKPRLAVISKETDAGTVTCRFAWPGHTTWKLNNRRITKDKLIKELETAE